jgi:hypothetical protein
MIERQVNYDELELVGSGCGLMRLEGLRKTTKNLNQYTFEAGTSQIRSRSVNHSATMFGVSHRIHHKEMCCQRTDYAVACDVSVVRSLQLKITRYEAKNFCEQ